MLTADGADSALTLGAVAFAFGTGSAIVPVMNAEAFVLATTAAQPHLWWLSVLAVSLGQVLGKVLMFQAARRGRSLGWFSRKKRSGGASTSAPSGWRIRLRTASEQLLRHLDRPVIGPLVVLLSAAVGIPPLAAVAVLAGMRSMPTMTFALTATAGRLLRFALLAWPVITATT